MTDYLTPEQREELARRQGMKGPIPETKSTWGCWLIAAYVWVTWAGIFWVWSVMG